MHCRCIIYDLGSSCSSLTWLGAIFAAEREGERAARPQSCYQKEHCCKKRAIPVSSHVRLQSKKTSSRYFFVGSVTFDVGGSAR